MSIGAKSNKIAKNFSYMAGGRILGDVFTFLLFVVIARVYGQNGLGEYSFAMAFSGFLVVFVDYGLTNYSIKELSKKNAFQGDHYGGIFSIRLVLSAIVFLLLILLLPYIPVDGNKDIIIIISLSQVIISLVASISAALIARQDSHLVGIMEFVYRLFSAVAVIIPALLGQSLLVSLATLPIIGFIYLLAIYIFVSKKYGRPPIIFKISYYINTLKEAFSYALFMLLQQISTRTDVIIIGLMLGLSSVGVYNAAYRIIFLLMLVAYFVELALMPVITDLFQNKKNDIVRLYNQSFGVVILIAIPISAGLWLTSDEIILLVFGSEFIESSLILAVLSWVVLLAFIKSIIGVFLTSCEMQSFRTKGQWYSAFVNIFGTVLLIPYLGILGAAIATIISEIVLVVINGNNLSKIVGIPKINKRLFMGTVGSIVFCVIILSMGSVSLFISIPFAALIYLSVLLMFKDFRDNELQLFRQLVIK